MKRRTDYQTIAFTAVLSMALTVPLAGQAVSTPEATEPPPATEAPPIADEDEEVIVLSPFEVSASDTEGYKAATTLAGNRLNTELRDIGSAVQVVTAEFLRDTGATGNETLLQYTTSTEVGSVHGNFAGVGDTAQLNETDYFTRPSQNTRVRGLTNADNTRDYFLSDVPWDSYNVDRVDLQRGPNSILFGQGSPAGIINSGTKPASFANSGEIEVRVDNYGSFRTSLDINRELIPDELAIRIALLRDDTKYKQEPAYQLSERGFGALRWEPGFLKKGSARTILRASFESGDIESNRPRTLPPGDYITPWFYEGDYTGQYTAASQNLVPGTDPDGRTSVTAGAVRYYQHLNKMTTNPHVQANDNFYRPDLNHGLIRPGINGGPFNGYANPHYNPWIGQFGASIGGPVAYYDTPDQAAPSRYIAQEIRETFGINTSGSVDGSLAFDFNRLAGIASYSDWARNAQVEWGQYGVFKNLMITDPSIFDFYNQLIDGPNKKEWQDFDVANISLAQTFFNDKIGFDLTYNHETFERGQLSLITDTRQGIYIDINTVHTDGTQSGTGTYPNNVPFDDGTPNPNLGRPFISDNGQYGNNSYLSERESKRVTAFFQHDFEREGEGSSWIARLAGKHVFTGLLADDRQSTDQRNWMRYAVMDPAYRAFFNSTAKFNEGQTFVPSQVIYVGDSLLDANSAVGANLRAPSEITTLPNASLRIFDSHWGHSLNPESPDYVNPADPWNNEFYPSDTTTDAWFAANNQTNPYYSRQSENPANYVGWTNIPLQVTDSESSQENRDLLTTSAQLERKLTTTKAFVWQAHLWDNSIVGTYGVRWDRAQGWFRSMNTDSGNNEEGEAQTLQYGHLNLDPEVYALPASGTPRAYSDLDERSTSWSVVGHFNQLPFIGEAVDKLPVNVSVFYNESENFQPEALRVDVYGEPLPLPRGKTKDMGLLFSTKDGKYSLRINKYKTQAFNANSNALSGNATSYLGNLQAWGANWANTYEYDLQKGNQPSDQVLRFQANNRPDGAPNPEGWGPVLRAGNADYNATNSLYNFGTSGDYPTTELALAREAAVVAAWRTFQEEDVDPRFIAAWNINLDAPFAQDPAQQRGVTASTPNGFRLTEDSTSEGYEVEFTAQPTRNWRIAVNAAKTEATRTNIGGANLEDYVNTVNEALNTTPAGDLRIWWGGAGNETTLYQWNRNTFGEWAGRKAQDNTNVPELREWRVNLITNYDFTEGRLRGLSVGGGVRYESDVVIGYPPVLTEGEISDELSFDISQPYKGPSETNFDFWVGYQKRLADKVDWRIQLNIRNAFTGNELIPITTQPDGTPAAYRIAPPRTLTLTNTFRF